jgi:hypothetical protein
MYAPTSARLVPCPVRERGRVRGVTHQRDSAVGPAGHADLADRVEEQVICVTHGGNHARDLPPCVGEDPGDQVTLGFQVSERVEQRLRVGEVQASADGPVRPQW